MITSRDKVHLKRDCVDGSIVNGIEEQIIFFNLNVPSEKNNFERDHDCFKKTTKKTNLDHIQIFLEDSKHTPIVFNNESLTFTIQIIKI